MNALLVFTNPWVFAQEIAVSRVLGILNFDTCVNPNYFADDRSLGQAEAFLRTHYNFVPFLELSNKTYDVIVRPTPASGAPFGEIHKIFLDASYIFVDEGRSCYTQDGYHVSPENNIECETLLNSKIYLSYPGLASPYFMQAVENLYSIPMNFVYDELTSLFSETLATFPVYADRVVFTEPFVGEERKQEFERMMSLFPGTTVLKRHPRNVAVYNLPGNVYLADMLVPGQMLFRKYPEAEFLLTGVSTVSMFAPASVKIRNLNLNKEVSDDT